MDNLALQRAAYNAMEKAVQILERQTATNPRPGMAAKLAKMDQILAELREEAGIIICETND